MKTERLDAATAMTSIIALRGIAKPNEGFLTQLRVWEEMGCTIQEGHPYVRQKTLEALSERQLAGDSVDKESLAIPDDSIAAQVQSHMQPFQTSQKSSTKNQGLRVARLDHSLCLFRSLGGNQTRRRESRAQVTSQG